MVCYKLVLINKFRIIEGNEAHSNEMEMYTYISPIKTIINNIAKQRKNFISIMKMPKVFLDAPVGVQPYLTHALLDKIDPDNKLGLCLSYDIFKYLPETN